MTQCLLCSKNVKNEFDLTNYFKFKPLEISMICKECQSQFELLNDVVCPICSRQMTEIQVCTDCLRWQKDSSWFRNKAIYRYNTAMKNYMRQYKFLGDYQLKSVFQAELKQVIDKKSIIVPIPISDTTLKKRGFNQVVGLLENLEYQELLMSKNNKLIDQSKKNREQRLHLEQPFCINDRLTEKIPLDKKIVLVDDVYTTGTTIRLAAKLLKDFGYSNISGLTLAR